MAEAPPGTNGFLLGQGKPVLEVFCWRGIEVLPMELRFIAL